jgi:ribosomal protein S18 acetylase RimI-like enzyme
MIDELPTKELVIRLANPEDIPSIEYLDSLSTSPTRDIHRDMEKYFGSIDPSTHEHTCIFLAEIRGTACAKAELMLPPADATEQIGYVKRVIVDPQYRGKGLARLLMQHLIDFAHTERHLTTIDLHVWEENRSAIRLYESLGFGLQHRELYYRLKI